MNNVFVEQGEKLGNTVVEALNKNGFKAQFVANKEQALVTALKLIGKGDSVGMGGSQTVTAIGLEEALKKQGNIVFNHQGLSKEEAFKVRREELTADVFVAGANAVTLEGELVNVDGSGNRVAAMTFGPGKIIIIAGINKIVEDEEAGRERIKMVAAPLNCIRLQRHTPCVAVGKCMDCHSPERICNVTSIIHRPVAPVEYHIIIVGEPLGY